MLTQYLKQPSFSSFFSLRPLFHTDDENEPICLADSQRTEEWWSSLVVRHKKFGNTPNRMVARCNENGCTLRDTTRLLSHEAK